MGVSKPGRHGSRSRRHALTLGLAWACAFGAPCARSASLEVYGRLPHLEDVALSPDGSRVAYVRTEGNERFVAVTELDHNKLLTRLRAGDEKLRRVAWADNDHLLIETSVTTFPRGFGFVGPDYVGEWFQAQVYDLKTGRAFMIPKPNAFSDLSLMNIVAGSIVARRFKEHGALFVPGVTVGGQSAITLIRVDLDTEGSRVVAPARPGTFAWVVDAAGDVVAEETYDTRSGHWSILTRRDGQMQLAVSGEGLVDLPRLLGLGPNPDTVLVSGLDDGEWVWRLLSIKDGSLGAPMVERRTLERPVDDPLTGRMIGGMNITDSDYLFFDPGVQQRWLLVVRAFHDERVRFVSASADYHKLIVRVEGERDGYCYELVDLNTHHADALGDVYEGVNHPFETRRITYTAADGLQIPAYLTLPRGKAPEKLPLVVLPHGGPAERATGDFDWWAQALADEGYAVLQANYRGSNLSRTFVARGFGEWGRKMQTDLSDGVRFLAKEGTIDPGRVCIAGASYGGYAALAGVTLDPGVYRCAVSVAGIADLRRMLAWTNERVGVGPANGTQRYWDRFMGVKGPNDPAADAVSPIRHVDGVEVPVLLIHGRDDTVVPFEQSAAMYDALHAAHKDVQLVTLHNEDHWLSRSETRLQMLQNTVEFLRAHNPPDQGP
jgi:dipeptidyl aminopeptidase/acylaminoacyl peptidase